MRDFLRQGHFFLAGLVFLLILPVAYLFTGGSRASGVDPAHVLERYLKAAYARN